MENLLISLCVFPLNDIILFFIFFFVLTLQNTKRGLIGNYKWLPKAI